MNLKRLNKFFDVSFLKKYHSEETLKEHPGWSVSNFDINLWVCRECGKSFEAIDDFQGLSLVPVKNHLINEHGYLEIRPEETYFIKP